jgi:hypothetical protein
MTTMSRYTPRGRQRAFTISVKRFSKRRLQQDAQTTGDLEPIPRTWGECQERALGTLKNPCWYLRCRYNLLLDLDPRNGSYKVTWPDLTSGAYGDEYHALPAATCVLHEAASGGLTLEEIGQAMNLTRERVRQIETKALYALRDLSELVRVVDDELDTYSPGSGAHGDLDHHAWVGR